MLSSGIKNATRHLLCCSALEAEAFQLYQSVAKKMANPEQRALVISIAYDSLKHSKTIRELLKTVDKAEIDIRDCSKNWYELWQEIVEISAEVSEMESIPNEVFCEIFKGLAELETFLSDGYCFLMELKIPECLANELGKLTPVNLHNMNNIFDGIFEDKQRHRETLIEIGYCFAAKDTEHARDNAPVVRYQNPDAWHRQLVA